MERPAQSSQDDPPRKRHKVWGWVFAGCGTVLGVGVVIAVLFVALLARGRAQFTPVLEEFLNLVEQREYDRAYSLLGDDWKEADTPDEFQNFVVLVSDALGTHESVHMMEVSYQKNLGSAPRATAVFSVQFEKAPATLRVTLQKYEDGWRIEGIHYDSDAIVSKFTCPHCGTVNRHDARHCSTCGTKIEPPKGRTTERQREAA